MRFCRPFPCCSSWPTYSHSGKGLWFPVVERATTILSPAPTGSRWYSLTQRGVSGTGRGFTQGLLTSLIHNQLVVTHFSRVTYAYSCPEISLLLCLPGQSLAQLSCHSLSDLGQWASPSWVSLSSSLICSSNSRSGHILPAWLPPPHVFVEQVLLTRRGARHWGYYEEQDCPSSCPLGP